MKATAVFDSRIEAWDAVDALVRSHFSVRGIQVETVPEGIDVPVVRRNPFVRLAVIGTILGAVAGGLLVVVGGLASPDQSPWFLVGLGAIWGLFAGAILGAGIGRVEVVFPAEEGRASGDRYLLRVDVPEGRAQQAEDVLRTAGGDVRPVVAPSPTDRRS